MSEPAPFLRYQVKSVRAARLPGFESAPQAGWAEYTTASQYRRSNRRSVTALGVLL